MKLLSLVSPIIQLGNMLVFALALLTNATTAQQLKIAEFVLFSGNGGAGTALPGRPGYGVQIGAESTERVTVNNFVFDFKNDLTGS